MITDTLSTVRCDSSRVGRPMSGQRSPCNATRSEGAVQSLIYRGLGGAIVCGAWESHRKIIRGICDLNDFTKMRVMV